MKLSTKEFNKVDGYEMYSDDIAAVLATLSGIEDDTVLDDCIEAIEHLHAVCQNEYNNDCFRTFYFVLGTIADRINGNSNRLKDITSRLDALYKKEYGLDDAITEEEILIDPLSAISFLLMKVEKGE